MKLKFWLIAVLVIFGTVETPVFASPADESDLLKFEQTWIDANSNGDTDTLNALIDDSYVSTTPYGKLYKKDMLQPQTPGLSQKLKNLTVHVDGDRGVVFGENAVSFANGKRDQISFVDKFERNNGRWRIVSSFVTR